MTVSNKRSEVDQETELDIAIIGAGLSGLYALYKLRELNLRVRVYDDAGDVGGTWWWNRYPGARVDSPGAPFYCYTFSEELVNEWDWTETQPDQPAIHSYLSYVADKFALRQDVQLRTRTESARYDESIDRWLLHSDHGERISARYLVSAVGTLSAAYMPQIKGIEDYAGELYHTGHWPQDRDVSFEGKTVGVIGTGSSGVQIIPEIAKTAKKVVVFQRTPQYVLPARNRPLPEELVKLSREEWPAIRRRIMETGRPLPSPKRSALDDTPENRRATYERAWNTGGMALRESYSDHMTDVEANQAVADFVKDKIREIVRDQQLAEQLLPDFMFGTRRLILGTEYYETYNRPNVELVNLRKDPINMFTESGVNTSTRSFDLDMLVLATGYDALTGAITRLNPVGRNGVTLQEEWADGARTYLGIGIRGFPNLFMIHGPQTPSVKFHMGLGTELEADWIAACIDYMESHRLVAVEPTEGMDVAWAREVEQIAQQTLYPRTDSWYTGANIPGKPRQFAVHLAGPLYHQRLRQVAEADYEGFTFRRDGEEEVVYPEALSDYSEVDTTG